MLSKLEIIHPRFPTVPLTFDRETLSTDPFQIRNIEGLGPVPASISSTQNATFDGDVYSGSFVGSRNIVITFGFNPDYTTDQSVSSLRAEAYKYFMPKQNLKVVVYVDEVAHPCWIDGIVETVEPVIFAQEPEMSVSIMCPSPYFTEDNDVVVTDTALLMPASTPAKLVTYSGTVPVGFNCKLQITSGSGSGTNNRDIEVITRAYDPDYQYESFKADNVTLVTSTYPVLTTEPGKKNLQQSASGILSNNLGKMTNESVWPRLYPGDNYVIVRSDLSGPTVTWTMTYQNKYGGF